MAFFKFRKAADEPASAPAAPQSLEAVRQRAKYRLVGASVLVLLGVIGFPLLFDKQPRPIAVDTPIDIPDRNKVPPLTLPAPPASEVSNAVAVAPAPPVPVASAVVKPPQRVVSDNEPGVITELAQPAKAGKTSEQKAPVAPINKASSATKSVVQELPKAAKPAASVALSKAADAAKAQAALEGKAVEAPAATEARYVVQVGAFADAAHAQEVRQKLERAGLKTYTHVAETKEGKRIRVRVGPFSAKPEAEKVAAKIKKLELPAALLTL